MASMFDWGLVGTDYPTDKVEYYLLYDKGGKENIKEEFYSVGDAIKRFESLSNDCTVTLLHLIKID